MHLKKVGLNVLDVLRYFDISKKFRHDQSTYIVCYFFPILNRPYVLCDYLRQDIECSKCFNQVWTWREKRCEFAFEELPIHPEDGFTDDISPVACLEI